MWKTFSSPKGFQNSLIISLSGIEFQDSKLRFSKLIVAKITVAKIKRASITKIVIPNLRHFQAILRPMANLFFSYVSIKKWNLTKCPKTRELLSGLRCAHIIKCFTPTKNFLLRNF